MLRPRQVKKAEVQRVGLGLENAIIALLKKMVFKL
jgi:hypothetical protein